MAAKYYAIKSCVQSVLHPLSASDDTKDIKVDFCNTFNSERTSSEVAAKADGVEVITLESEVKYTFKLGMEVLSEEVLAMLMGGTVDETGVIKVGKEAPTEIYSLTGTFKLYGDDGSVKIKKMTIGKCKPVVNSSIDFSSIDISSFELQFNMLIDEQDLFFKVENNPGV